MAGFRMVSTVARLQIPSPMVSTVIKLQNLIGYEFKNAQLAWEAVQAPDSVTRIGETVHARTIQDTASGPGFERLPDGNKRLAMVGDTALRLVLCEEWYLGNEVRERLNSVVSSVGTNEALNIVGRQHNLQDLINDNPGRIALRKMRSEEIAPLTMASTVEAILGAVYMDGGMAPVAEVVQKLGIKAPTFRKVWPKRSNGTVWGPSKRSIAEAMGSSEVSVEDAKGPMDGSSEVSVEDAKGPMDGSSEVSVEDAKGPMDGPSEVSVEEVKSPASIST